jgi:hypothetical protein
VIDSIEVAAISQDHHAYTPTLSRRRNYPGWLFIATATDGSHILHRVVPNRTYCIPTFHRFAIEMWYTLPWLILPFAFLLDAKPVRDANDFITISRGVNTLDSRSAGPAIHTLDYGRSVDGIPTFEVVSAQGDTSSFEITYGESSAALKTYMVSYLCSYNYRGTPLLIHHTSSPMAHSPWQQP